MLPVAFLTQENLDDPIGDDAAAVRALGEMGYTVEAVPWQAPARWRHFRAAVVRSTWDYQSRPLVFLDALHRIAGKTLLQNDFPTISWNVRKDYLERRFSHLPRIPSLPGVNLSAAFLERAFAELATDELLVKPMVGAGAAGILRLRRDQDFAEALSAYAHAEFLLQPYLPSVAEHGEISLVFFGGSFSHCVRKRTRPGEFRVQQEYGGTVESCAPQPAESELAERVMRCLSPVPLYARVDLVQDGKGAVRLMEVELTEPTLFFQGDAAAGRRFAEELDRRLFRADRVLRAR